MIRVPAEWSQLGGEVPLLEKGSGVPFILIAENSRDVLLCRRESRVCFQLFDVAADNLEDIKTNIIGLMEDLYDTWTGLLPDQGHGCFYGVVRDRGVERSGMNWVRLGLGYTTYPITDTLGYVRTAVGYSTIPLPGKVKEDKRVRDWCEKNQLPYELVIDP